MRCREFRNNHVAFVDDLLSAVEMDAMLQHVIACARCARHDTAVRRSLLLFRNLPSVEPSPDFMHRLNARLANEDAEQRYDLGGRSFRPTMRGAAGVAAAVAAIAVLAVGTTRHFGESNDPSSEQRSALQAGLASSMADMFGTGAAPMPGAAFVASVSTGIPVWPAVLMAGQSPMRFASLEFHDGSDAP